MRAEDVVDERDEEKTVEQKAEAIKAKRVEHIERRRKRRRVRVRRQWQGQDIQRRQRIE